LDWEALEVLRNAGARIVRTDSDGATTVPWTAGLLLVRTYGAGGFVVETGAARVVAVGSVTFKVR
jgi:hypothetical protein